MEKKNKIHSVIHLIETQVGNLPEEPETNEIKPILNSITTALKELTSKVEDLEGQWVDDYFNAP